MKADDYLLSMGLDWEEMEFYENLWEFLDWNQYSKNQLNNPDIQKEIYQRIVYSEPLFVVYSKERLRREIYLSDKTMSIPEDLFKGFVFTIRRDNEGGVRYQKLEMFRDGVDMESFEKETIDFIDKNVEGYKLRKIFGDEKLKYEVYDFLEEVFAEVLQEISSSPLAKKMENRMPSLLVSDFLSVSDMEKQQKSFLWEE